jgi:hypothetical protein
MIQSQDVITNFYTNLNIALYIMLFRCRNEKPVGLFHELPIELQDSLVVTSKRKSPESRQKFRESLQMQRERRFEKKQAARNKKVEGEMAQVMANSYLWQKYDSPWCCKLAKGCF